MQNAPVAKNTQTIRDGSMKQRGAAPTQQQKDAAGAGAQQENEENAAQQQNKSAGRNCQQRNVAGGSAGQTNRSGWLGRRRERYGSFMNILCSWQCADFIHSIVNIS